MVRECVLSSLGCLRCARGAHVQIDQHYAFNYKMIIILLLAKRIHCLLISLNLTFAFLLSCSIRISLLMYNKIIINGVYMEAERTREKGGKNSDFAIACIRINVIWSWFVHFATSLRIESNLFSAHETFATEKIQFAHWSVACWFSVSIIRICFFFVVVVLFGF